MYWLFVARLVLLVGWIAIDTLTPTLTTKTMKYLRKKLQQLSRAMEFVNIDTLGELEKTLESQEISVAARNREAVARRVAYCERKSGRGSGRAVDFSTFAGSAIPNLFGQS